MRPVSASLRLLRSSHHPKLAHYGGTVSSVSHPLQLAERQTYLRARFSPIPLLILASQSRQNQSPSGTSAGRKGRERLGA